MRFRDFYEAKLPPTRPAKPGENLQQLWDKFKTDDPEDQQLINQNIRYGFVPDETQQQQTVQNPTVSQNYAKPPVPGEPTPAQTVSRPVTSAGQWQQKQAQAAAAPQNPMLTGTATAAQHAAAQQQAVSNQMAGRGGSQATAEELTAKAKELGLDQKYPNLDFTDTSTRNRDLLNQLGLVAKDIMQRNNFPFYWRGNKIIHTRNI